MGYETFEKLCRAKNVRPADISKATGIATATLTSWKKGVYTPKQDKLQKIADYFGVTIEYLMTGEEPSKEEKYYLNEETAKLAQELFDNPDMRILFDAARDSKPEDLQRAADLLKRFKETNPDG